MTDQPGGPMNFNPEDPAPWASLDDFEREAKPHAIERMREHYLNQVEPQIVEGRVVRPGEPSPGRNQRAYAPSPDPRGLMMRPLEGRAIPGGTYSAFALDGPAAGKWVTEHDHWRAVELDHHRDVAWYAMNPSGAYQDEALSYKQTLYSLQRLAIGSGTRPGEPEPTERRQYWFWSSVPVWEMDPAAAVFLLIDAEPWQTALCRVPDPTTMPRY